MTWIVKTSSNLGTDDANAAAADLIGRSPAWRTKTRTSKSKSEKAMVSLHSLGASLRAKRGQYDKAKKQIEAVIQKFPKALEPRVSEAKILTEWAGKEPAKYDKAIAIWDTLRKKLERVSNPDPKKPADAGGSTPSTTSSSTRPTASIAGRRRPRTRRMPRRAWTCSCPI